MAEQRQRAAREAAIHHRFQWLLASCRALSPLRMGVIHPCDALSLHGALTAASLGLIEPVLFGPEQRVREIAVQLGRSLDGLAIHPSRDPIAAAADAATAAAEGRVEALMKGAIHTADMMHVLLASTSHLRTGRRMSHAFAIDAPGYAHPLVISDAVLNVRPGLEQKRAICQNAIDLAVAIGIGQPRVAVLAAVETVHAAMPSTVDAAALTQMAARGQITGAVVDGPLALDDAIHPAAVKAKQLDSAVAGRANILIVPDLEAGNLLVKELVLLADGLAAGIVLGGAVPIALNGRADGVAARVASAALTVLIAAGAHPAA